jgi:leucyl aminopeptidase
MQLRIASGPLALVEAQALVVPVWADRSLDGAAEPIEAELGGAIADILASGEISGKAGESALVRAKDRPYQRVLAVGLGDREKFSAPLLARYAGTAVRYLGKRNIHSIAFALPLAVQGDLRAAASFIVEGALAATLDTTIYQGKPERAIVLEELIVSVGDAAEADVAALTEGAQRGKIVGEAVNLARRLALTPGNDMTPTHLAKEAERVAHAHGLAYHALDEDQMFAKGMGAILGVSVGSDQPAKMIVLEYHGDPGSAEKLALVGKGLTFDSGGISIKPADRMEEMKYDMSGGAAVIGALGAIAQLKPKLNVIGIVPSSENLPGPAAVKPGDILRAMNGKTIEVINTDAEGRLILADALCYARELGATKIVDAATLTGAMVVALGHAATGTMSNDDAFVEQFLAAAKESGERYWRMPLYDEFAKDVTSEIADLRNSAGRWAGSLTAGKFLEAFVEKTPWIHLDIAGTAYLDSESAYAAKGPTGTPIRAFVALVEALANAPAEGDVAKKHALAES